MRFSALRIPPFRRLSANHTSQAPAESICSDLQKTRRERLAAAVECLESRTLLSVSVTQQIAPVTLTTTNTSTTVDLSQNFTDPQTTGTFVQFDTSLGSVEVQLFNKDTPLTVANFLQYVNQGLYNNTIIHRSVPDFVVQGGGFTPTGAAIQTFAPVQNEPVFSNVLGTIAMAKVAGDPNSATSQYFFNVADNSQALDNQNGGFTVFGDVVQGLNIVQSINALPTVSATIGANSFTDLPLLTAGGGTAPSNLVDVSSVQTVAAPQLQITAVSDNTRLVTTSITGEQLSLSAVPGRTGFAHITVTATGPSGTSVTQVLRVHVVGSQTLDIQLGAGHPHAVSYQDFNGNSGTLSVGGPGSTVATFSGSGLVYRGGAVRGQDVELDGVTATDTTARSSIIINGPASAKQSVAIGDVTITGSAAQVRLHHALLVGDLSASGAVHTLEVDSAEDGTIAVGSGGRTSFQGTTLAEESFTSAAPIDALKVENWINQDPTVVITAPSIRSVFAKGNFSVGLNLSAASHALGAIKVRGSIGGDWTVNGKLPTLNVVSIDSTFSGTFAAAIPSLHLRGDMDGALSVPSIGNLRIDGSLGGVLRLTGALTPKRDDLTRLRVRGEIVDADIISTGNIGAITARGISASDIFAGVGSLETNAALPGVESDFSGHASIGSVKSTGRKDVLGYSASNIAAWTLGKLQLGTTKTKNSGTAFGVAGHTIQNLFLTDLSKNQTFSFTRVTDATALAKLIAARKLTLNDLEISIV